MDVALEPKRRAVSVIFMIVSILVLVDVALEPNRLAVSVIFMIVSILVLVDVALEHFYALPIDHIGARALSIFRCTTHHHEVHHIRPKITEGGAPPAPKCKPERASGAGKWEGFGIGTRKRRGAKPVRKWCMVFE